MQRVGWLSVFDNDVGYGISVELSDDHVRVIGRVQDCVLRGGRFINAVYRGFAKSTISEVLAGKKPFSRQMIRKLSEYFKVDVSVLTANL